MSFQVFNKVEIPQNKELNFINRWERQTNLSKGNPVIFSMVKAKEFKAEVLPGVLKKDDPFHNETQWFIFYRVEHSLKLTNTQVKNLAGEYIRKVCRDNKWRHEFLVTYINTNHKPLDYQGKNYYLCYMIATAPK